MNQKWGKSESITILQRISCKRPQLQKQIIQKLNQVCKNY
jgi:hypothetical protein